MQSELKQRGISFLALDQPAFDLMSPVMLESALEERGVEAVINCAAYTDVPRAESDFHRAMQINGSCMKPIAEMCRRHDVFLVHVSTDYVFDGTKGAPYVEDDHPNPLSIYGISKLMGEMIVRQYAGDYAIVRTAGLYGTGNPDNIVEKLIRLGSTHASLKMVTDEVTSPTCALDLAKQLLLIVENRIDGIVHASSNGQCNWLEFAEVIFEKLGMDIELEPVPSSYFHKNLKKPLFSVLSNEVLQK